MFHKSIRIKTNNQIKSSERKAFFKDILSRYPSIDEESLKSVINIKESEINLTKLYTHGGNDVQVYMVDKIPYAFKLDKNDQLIPTVYLLWKYPDILPKFYTHPSVLERLVNGADLMLPGVIVKSEINLYTFKHIQKDQLCVVCLQGNKVPVAIGRAAMSGDDMYMSQMKGKCVNIIHVYRDNLWALGDQTISLPVIPDIEEPLQVQEKEQATSEITTQEENIENLKLSDTNHEDKSVAENTQEEVSELTDELLQIIFITALKYKSKEFTLPVIVSTFMKTLQSCW